MSAKSILCTFATSFLLFAKPAFGESFKLVVFGQIPGQYFPEGQVEKNTYRLGFVAMQDRVISSLGLIPSEEHQPIFRLAFEKAGYQVVEAKNSQGQYDILYPGLIDLHGHNKQNMLPTWTGAFGRYANRHEWRQRSEDYNKVQSNNMNPWSNLTAAKVAAYRWSELQAMVLGTTYLQGHTLYDKEFAIHSVEDRGAFISERGAIESGTDYVDPYKWGFLWNELRTEIENVCDPSYECYQRAITQWLQQNCELKNVQLKDIQAQISVLDVVRGETDSQVRQLITDKLNQSPQGEEAWHELIYQITELVYGELVEGVYTDRKVSFYLELRSRFNAQSLHAIAQEIGLSPMQKMERIHGLLKAWLDATTMTVFRDVVVGVPLLVATAPASDLALKWFDASEPALRHSCQTEPMDSLVDFFAETFGNRPHQTIVRRNQNLSDPLGGAIITHLSEGRRLDPASWVEFQLLKLSGLARKGMNFIHGVGLTADDFHYMAANQMGLVWSPYSNFLLYGETLDLKAALEAGVLIALGSDWSPTGSKSVLDELKVATEYIDKNNINIKRADCDTIDECVYNMVTKNSAIIMNHYGFESETERGVGTLQVGAMASLIAVRIRHSNPFTNLVRFARAQDINLVVVDGKPIYGNQSYLKDLIGLPTPEVISGKIFNYTLDTHPEAFPAPLSTPEMAMGIAKAAVQIPLFSSERCGFTEPKVFLQGSSRKEDYEQRVKPLFEATGLNLDSYNGITRFLGVALLSQSHNAIQGRSLSEGRVGFMPPLYSCEDATYWQSLDNMVIADQGIDTLTLMALGREWARLEKDYVTRVERQGDDWAIRFSEPFRLALLYQLVARPGTDQPRSIIEIELPQAPGAE